MLTPLNCYSLDNPVLVVGTCQVQRGLESLPHEIFWKIYYLMFNLKQIISHLVKTVHPGAGMYQNLGFVIQQSRRRRTRRTRNEGVKK
jgi:hypothetical protein